MKIFLYWQEFRRHYPAMATASVTYYNGETKLYPVTSRLRKEVEARFPGFPVDETETDAFGHPVTDQASS